LPVSVLQRLQLLATCAWVGVTAGWCGCVWRLGEVGSAAGLDLGVDCGCWPDAAAVMCMWVDLGVTACWLCLTTLVPAGLRGPADRWLGVAAAGQGAGGGPAAGDVQPGHAIPPQGVQRGQQRLAPGCRPHRPPGGPLPGAHGGQQLLSGSRCCCRCRCCCCCRCCCWSPPSCKHAPSTLSVLHFHRIGLSARWVTLVTWSHSLLGPSHCSQKARFCLSHVPAARRRDLSPSQHGVGLSRRLPGRRSPARRSFTSSSLIFCYSCTILVCCFSAGWCVMHLC
jgi:hypothetical protein